jgi:serine protease
MPKARLLLPLAAVALLGFAGTAEAAEYVPGEVVVKYEGDTSLRQVPVEDGRSVHEAAAELRDDPDVLYAVPNYVAHASQWTPNDPGLHLQWNLFEEFGIGMPEAWSLASAAGAPGGKGAVVAVLDSGVAFERFKRYRRAPDLRASTFVHPYDFVDDDPHPNDAYGHGTHVAGTIAQATNNGQGTAGVAYGVKIMPLKVLNNAGEGDSVAIAKAIRYAARRRADVVNLSLEFHPSVIAAEIPEILSAMRYAHRRGTVIVGAAGNKFVRRVAYPARATQAIAVGAISRNGCQTDYSNSGSDLDLVAPGGGVDAPNADNPWDLEHCDPADGTGDWIYQQTFRGSSVQRFGLPTGYEGTSMAAPHVAAIAALVIATRKLGANPRPKAVQDHIQATSRDLGAIGLDQRYGWGLADAARALRCPPFTACV